MSTNNYKIPQDIRIRRDRLHQYTAALILHQSLIELFPHLSATINRSDYLSEDTGLRIGGIIMECNPLHAGHQHILRTMKADGMDYTVAAVSGDFVQRGIPSIYSKEIRTKALLLSGVDLVIELPVRYATGSAGYFAAAGVDLLQALGVITDLYFGSESGDLQYIEKASSRIESETDGLRIASLLKRGYSYPQAVSEVLRSSEDISDEDTHIPDTANDLLGMHYVRELSSISSAILPHAIKRIDTASASALREDLLKAPTAAEALVSEMRAALPGLIPQPMDIDRYSDALLSLLLRITNYGKDALPLTEYIDVSEDLANRITAKLPAYKSYTQFTQLLKTRNLTYTRVSRALLHILLGLKKSALAESEAAGRIGYARVLGFRRESRALLTAIKKEASVPLITKIGNYEAMLPSVFSTMLQEDIGCSFMYDLFHAAGNNADTIRMEQGKEIIIL